MMEIGRLNQRIVLLEHRTKIDEIGNHIAKWEEVTACWAQVYMPNSQTASAENSDSGTAKKVRKLVFIVRQNPFLLYLNSTTHRILFRGQIFNILSVKPNYEKNDYLTITAETRLAGDENDLY